MTDQVANLSGKKKRKQSNIINSIVVNGSVYLDVCVCVHVCVFSW